LKKTTSIRSKRDEKEELMQKEAELAEAIEAALDKKAQELVWLDLSDVCSFTDNFVICTGTSSRHNQSIADNVEAKLKAAGIRPLHVEGYNEGEWILMDYVDFVVHIFSARAREFYDLERLWRAGKRRDVQELIGQPTT
jgi:ribosome-associated protein